MYRIRGENGEWGCRPTSQQAVIDIFNLWKDIHYQYSNYWHIVIMKGE